MMVTTLRALLRSSAERAAPRAQTDLGYSCGLRVLRQIKRPANQNVVAALQPSR
jgi:hypothetical protein